MGLSCQALPFTSEGKLLSFGQDLSLGVSNTLVGSTCVWISSRVFPVDVVMQICHARPCPSRTRTSFLRWGRSGGQTLLSTESVTRLFSLQRRMINSDGK